MKPIPSSEPAERLVRVSDRRVDTRPIAGTTPRSRLPGEDPREMHELVSHPKERAEHIMLIDLERNDLGRVQIIAELEAAGRGAYTGSLGYLTVDGTLDLNILIRTMTLRGGQLSFRAGAGIVADSDPERELEETRAKARGLIAALGDTA